MVDVVPAVSSKKRTPPVLPRVLAAALVRRPDPELTTLIPTPESPGAGSRLLVIAAPVLSSIVPEFSMFLVELPASATTPVGPDIVPLLTRESPSVVDKKNSNESTSYVAIYDDGYIVTGDRYALIPKDEPVDRNLLIVCLRNDAVGVEVVERARARDQQCVPGILQLLECIQNLGVDDDICHGVLPIQRAILDWPSGRWRFADGRSLFWRLLGAALPTPSAPMFRIVDHR